MFRATISQHVNVHKLVHQTIHFEEWDGSLTSQEMKSLPKKRKKEMFSASHRTQGRMHFAWSHKALTLTDLLPWTSLRFLATVFHFGKLAYLSQAQPPVEGLDGAVSCNSDQECAVWHSTFSVNKALSTGANLMKTLDSEDSLDALFSLFNCRQRHDKRRANKLESHEWVQLNFLPIFLFCFEGFKASFWGIREDSEPRGKGLLL